MDSDSFAVHRAFFIKGKDFSRILADHGKSGYFISLRVPYLPDGLRNRGVKEEAYEFS